MTACSGVGGAEEKAGPLGDKMDFHDPSDAFGAMTWEKAEGEQLSLALSFALNKRNYGYSDVDVIFSGDLQNQCTASAHGICPTGIPYIGLYASCSTCTEGLLLASLCMGYPEIRRAAAVTGSHNCAAERQFRLPLEYGGQRSPTAGWTATAAGAFLVEREKENALARICRVMPGKMVDGGIKDAGNMGAAMAPAAADSIFSFLSQTGQSPEDYDAIVTGDLGYVGSALLWDLLKENGMDIRSVHKDCGCMIYDKKKQDVHAGGSGCGCSALALAAHFLPYLRERVYRKILFLSTGALMSPSSVAQGESVIGIAPLLELSAPD
ncbi:MAG: stage V sporulation protein AD [Clostridia bacterium]|nr:stage V sporulation protein AD [Clostridia bacterium]